MPKGTGPGSGVSKQGGSQNNNAGNYSAQAGRGQGNAGGWPSMTGQPSGGNRSNATK